jgi:hypothetical protein
MDQTERLLSFVDPLDRPFVPARGKGAWLGKHGPIKYLTFFFFFFFSFCTKERRRRRKNFEQIMSVTKKTPACLVGRAQTPKLLISMFVVSEHEPYPV